MFAKPMLKWCMEINFKCNVKLCDIQKLTLSINVLQWIHLLINAQFFSTGYLCFTSLVIFSTNVCQTTVEAMFQRLHLVPMYCTASTHQPIFNIKCHMLNVSYQCNTLHHQHINRYSHFEHRMSHAYHLIFSSNGSQLRGVCHKHTHLSGIFSIKHFKMFHIC